MNNERAQQEQVTQMHYRYGQTATKNGIWSLSTAPIKQKKQSTFHSGWFERQQRGVRIASSKFSEPKRFVYRLNIVEEKYIQEQQPN